MISTTSDLLRDDETDYEDDEVKNYRKLGILRYIIWLICSFFAKKPRKGIRCSVCYEKFESKRMVSCGALNHRICGKCLREIAKNTTYLEDLNVLVQGYPCPEWKCRRFLSYGETRFSISFRILNPLIFSQLFDKNSPQNPKSNYNENKRTSVKQCRNQVWKVSFENFFAGILNSGNSPPSIWIQLFQMPKVWFSRWSWGNCFLLSELFPFLLSWL